MFFVPSQLFFKVPFGILEQIYPPNYAALQIGNLTFQMLWSGDTTLRHWFTQALTAALYLHVIDAIAKHSHVATLCLKWIIFPRRVPPSLRLAQLCCLKK